MLDSDLNLPAKRFPAIDGGMWLVFSVTQL